MSLATLLESRYRAGVFESREYELLVWLTDTFDVLWSTDALLALFQKHFLIRHGLYQAERYFAERGIVEELSPVGVKLRGKQADSEISTAIQPASADLQLREFYGNLDNFFKADRDAVAHWIDSFWKQFALYEGAPQAFADLGLSSDASWPEVQRQYRSLVNQHHPDKGGDGGRFTKVRDAYETLRQRYNKKH
ncbi:DnaJ-like protein [Alteromonadaceae bacterium 2753L.S.0a.02]|nr:DnaJ-like protein [Alteromonadaceae bacterium 2753L.S.0a.02]